MSRRAVHICIYKGERTGLPPPPGTKCELSPRPRSCRRAVEYAGYPWGSAALCAKHMDEECGPAKGEKDERQ